MEIQYGEIQMTIKTKSVHSQFGGLTAIAIPELEDKGGPAPWRLAFLTEKDAIEYAKKVVDGFVDDYFSFSDEEWVDVDEMEVSE